jgi:hypothetical protein
MVTYAQIIDDIRVSMGFVVDDSPRSDESILYNVILAVNKLKKRLLAKADSSWDSRLGSDLQSTFIVPVIHRDMADDDVSDWDASYFDLPTSIYSLAHDGGVSFIRYLRNEIPCGCPPAIAKVPFTGTTLASLNALYGSAYQRPRVDAPYYARARATENGVVKDRVYLFGIPCDLKNLFVGLYASADYSAVDPDSPIDLPDEYLGDLRKMLLADEAWLLMVPQERLKNDGRFLEPGEQVQTPKLVSVNNPINTEAE